MPFVLVRPPGLQLEAQLEAQARSSRAALVISMPRPNGACCGWRTSSPPSMVTALWRRAAL